jgi:signal transduction histidine kinase
MISLILTANIFFLEDYYIYKTESIFQKEYELLLQEFNIQNRDFLDLIRERSAETGLKYIISKSDSKIILSSVPDFRRDTEQRLSKENQEILFKLRNRKYYGSVSRGNSTKTDLVLVSNLKSDLYLFIIKPMEQLKDNAAIANDFLIIMGLFTLFLSVFAAYFIAGQAVKPILQITDISRRISGLDFSRKYEGKSKDEIGVLGESINQISQELDKTIKNLKNEMELQKRFLASVSHEFKTPVALIRGFSESLNLKMAQSEEEIQEISGIIMNESDRLNDLISDLLLLIRVDSTSFNLNISKFDLSETLRTITGKYEQLSNSRKCEFQLSIPEELSIQGDEKRIAQVIENLLNNAIRHSIEKGIIRINITGEEHHTILTIFNEGPLIPEEHLNHLFDPFYTIQDSRSRDTSGSGLGLSIVKSIMEKHGGTCSITNEHNGVSVHLTFS